MKLNQIVLDNYKLSKNKITINLNDDLNKLNLDTDKKDSKIINYNNSNFNKNENYYKLTSNYKDENITTIESKLIKISDIASNIFSNYNNLTEINIDNASLNYVPEEIINLKNLKVIKLDNNQISSFPYFIGKLDKLEHISIINNFIEKIPSSIQHLNKLQSLKLSKNRLKNIPIEFGLLKSLEVLYLDSNYFTNLPTTLCYLKKLKEFSLEWFEYLDPPNHKLIKDNIGASVIQFLRRSLQEQIKNGILFCDFFTFIDKNSSKNKLSNTFNNKSNLTNTNNLKLSEKIENSCYNKDIDISNVISNIEKTINLNPSDIELLNSKNNSKFSILNNTKLNNNNNNNYCKSASTRNSDLKLNNLYNKNNDVKETIRNISDTDEDENFYENNPNSNNCFDNEAIMKTKLLNNVSLKGLYPNKYSSKNLNYNKDIIEENFEDLNENKQTFEDLDLDKRRIELEKNKFIEKLNSDKSCMYNNNMNIDKMSVIINTNKKEEANKDINYNSNIETIKNIHNISTTKKYNDNNNRNIKSDYSNKIIECSQETAFKENNINLVSINNLKKKKYSKIFYAIENNYFGVVEVCLIDYIIIIILLL